MEVVEIEDHGVVSLPPRSGNYAAERIRDAGNVPYFPDGPRQDLKPVEITQPEGTSFTVDGHEVRWQKMAVPCRLHPARGWSFTWCATRTREHSGRSSTVPRLRKCSFPYGDPNPVHYRKTVFDIGEYGIGVLANSLEQGCDCLGEIYYFDAYLNDNDGHPQLIKNAICMHEEHRPGALAHIHRSPRGTPGGLASDAGHLRRVPAEGRRLLRRQPSPRRTALAAPPPPGLRPSAARLAGQATWMP
jgi:primary-amine oxidase